MKASRARSFPAAVTTVLLLALLTSCAPRARDTRSFDPGEPATSVLTAVNQQRRAGAWCGPNWYGAAPPVRLEPRLTRAAERHSADMRGNSFMGHVGSDGSRVGQRVTRAGYEWQVVGENVAWGQPTVEVVMTGWMGSPPHCAAIMTPEFRELGVAKDDVFWTMVLGKPR